MELLQPPGETKSVLPRGKAEAKKPAYTEKVPARIPDGSIFMQIKDPNLQLDYPNCNVLIGQNHVSQLVVMELL